MARILTVLTLFAAILNPWCNCDALDPKFGDEVCSHSHNGEHSHDQESPENGPHLDHDNLPAVLGNSMVSPTAPEGRELDQEQFNSGETDLASDWILATSSNKPPPDVGKRCPKFKMIELGVIII